MTAIDYLAADSLNHTPVSAANPLPVTGAAGGLPSNAGGLATPLQASSGNVANASAIATLTGAATTTVYLSGYEVTASGATSGLPVVGTITGLAGGTRSFIFTFPAGVLVAATPLVVAFPAPLKASAVNTPIVVTLPAGGGGNTNACVSAQGYHL
jgi:hypothetical protein